MSSAAGADGWAAVRFVAHRCGGRLAPENTLAGLRIAAARGYRAVEFDVMLSADAVPFLIHDETLERTTDGRGEVGRTAAAELRRRLANRGHEAEFPDERLPELADAAALCRELGLYANIEIKPAAGCEAITGEVVGRAVRALWREAPPPLLSSFSAAALAAARREWPAGESALLFGQVPGDWAAQMADLGCTSLHAAARQTDGHRLDAAIAAGVPVRCYTVNAIAEAKALFSRGVAAVFTDAIDLLPVGQ